MVFVIEHQDVPKPVAMLGKPLVICSNELQGCLEFADVLGAIGALIVGAFLDGFGAAISQAVLVADPVDHRGGDDEADQYENLNCCHVLCLIVIVVLALEW